MSLRPEGESMSRLARSVLARDATLVYLLPVGAVLFACIFTPENERPLRWLHDTVSLAWWSVAAVTVSAFAAGYAATERSPRSRAGSQLVALTLFAFALYAASTAIAYETDLENVELVARLLWGSVPLTVGFWVYAATTIAREVEREGRWNDPEPHGRWQWFRKARAHQRVRNVGKWAVGVSTAVFAIGGPLIGSAPLEESARRDLDPSWASLGFAWYLWAGFLVWMITLLTVAALYLTHAYVRRKPDLSREVRLRAGYAVFAGWFALASGVLLDISTLGHAVAAPLITLAVATMALALVLVLLDASLSSRRQRFRIRLRRRLFVSVVAITFALLLGVIASDGEVFGAASIAGLIAAAIPLWRPMQASLHGFGWRRSARLAPSRVQPALTTAVSDDATSVELGLPELYFVNAPELRSEDPDVDDDAERLLYLSRSDADALRALFVGGQLPSEPLADELIDHWEAALAALGELQSLRRAQNATGRPIKRILWGIDAGRGRDDGPSAGFDPSPEIDVAIEQFFPARNNDADELRRVANEWLRETAHRLAGVGIDKFRNPTAMFALEAECVARHMPEDVDEPTLEHFRALQAVRATYRTNSRVKPEGDTLKSEYQAALQNWNNRLDWACERILVEWQHWLGELRSTP